MKKIGIITINDNSNFGNRLQSYATQVTFFNLNVEAENIINIHKIKRLRKSILFFPKKIFYIFNIRNQKVKTIRQRNFYSFNKNIKFSNFKIEDRKVKGNLSDLYDSFFVGSDQVWNPYFGRMSDVDFLTFTPNKKRNSISASFGINTIPNELKNYYKEKLLEFNNISVREESGKSIIKELTDREDVEVLVDPTMLLSSDEWDKVSKKPEQIKENKKYILNYFLGELKEEWKNEINKVAKENDCYIINILDKKDPFYVSGPSEFLYLEKNAFLICTDSFHSSVFGIIYDTPFIVFDRVIEKSQSMNSRIDTLLSKFKLEDRKFNESITNELLNCDYSKSKEILEIEKEKSIKFLRKALDMKE